MYMQLPASPSCQALPTSCCPSTPVPSHAARTVAKTPRHTRPLHARSLYTRMQTTLLLIRHVGGPAPYTCHGTCDDTCHGTVRVLRRLLATHGI